MSVATRCLVVVALCAARIAAADGTTDRCVEAHHDAQTARRDGHLVEAKAGLARCALAECPALITADCTRWLAEVSALVPHVQLVVRDADGSAIVGVRVFVDNAQVDASSALELDPGAHLVRGEALGYGATTQSITVARNVSEQRFEIVLARTTTPPRASRTTLVLGGVGVVGLGMATGFGIAGLVERGHLDDQHCSPNCSPSAVSAIHRNFVIADVSLGIALVAITSAVLTFRF